MDTPKKILIVEDEMFILDLYNRVLTKAGYMVTTAVDGEDSLQKVNTDKPDLILLDIMMPKMSGMEALEKLKLDEQTKNIPVVMLTNLGDEEIMQKSLQSGATDFLVKAHVTPQNLCEKVATYFQ